MFQKFHHYKDDLFLLYFKIALLIVLTIKRVLFINANKFNFSRARNEMKEYESVNLNCQTQLSSDLMRNIQYIEIRNPRKVLDLLSVERAFRYDAYSLKNCTIRPDAIFDWT